MSKGLGNMMKQAQKLQQQMLGLQNEIGNREVEGSAGGGMVKVIMNGHQDLISIKIDPQVVDPEDVDLLEEMIVAAINNARDKAKELMETEMGKIIPGGLGGLNIPGF